MPVQHKSVHLTAGCFLCFFFQMCSACHNPGATLGCFFKGCPNKYHYRCALESGEVKPVLSFAVPPHHSSVPR